MPFKSKAQRRWMYANDPKMAAEWEEKTKNKDLPNKVGYKKRLKMIKRNK